MLPWSKLTPLLKMPKEVNQALTHLNFDNFCLPSNSAAKQQSLWVVSLWRSPLIFVWPGDPKDRWLGLIGAPSDGDWNAIWWYFVSMRLYLAMLFSSRIDDKKGLILMQLFSPPHFSCIKYFFTASHLVPIYKDLYFTFYHPFHFSFFFLFQCLSWPLLPVRIFCVKWLDIGVYCKNLTWFLLPKCLTPLHWKHQGFDQH